MSIVKVIECPRDAMQGIKDWIPESARSKQVCGCGETSARLKLG